MIKWEFFTIKQDALHVATIVVKNGLPSSHVQQMSTLFPVTMQGKRNNQCVDINGSLKSRFYKEKGNINILLFSKLFCFYLKKIEKYI